MINWEKELFNFLFFLASGCCLACKCNDGQGCRMHSATDPRCNPFFKVKFSFFFVCFSCRKLRKKNCKRNPARKQAAAVMRLSLISTDSCVCFCHQYSAPAHCVCYLSSWLQKAFLWHLLFTASASYHVQSKAVCTKEPGEEFGL